MDMLLFMNLGGVEIVMLLIIGVLPFILTVYCLIEIMRSQFADPMNKVLWVLIVLLAPLVGALLYLAWGRSQRRSLDTSSKT